MVPVGGEGECVKIIQVENGSLAELVEVFLGLTRGFDLSAGTVVLLSSPRHAAFVGTAEYAADFVRSSGQIRNAFMGGITVLHGIPFLLGGTGNTAANRAIAEIEHWVSITATGTDEISATRSAFMNTLRTDTNSNTGQHIIRLPVSQHSLEKTTVVTIGFDNLITAVDPISEEEEKSLLVFMLEELNNLYPLNLCTDIVCDRFLEEDVFDDSAMDRTDLVLIGASHLANVARNIHPKHWKISDLTHPGWRINNASVAEMVDRLTELSISTNLNNVTVVLQLFDNSVYMVGGPGGEKRLPEKDRFGTYHVDGSLVVADKPAIKDLVHQLSPLIQALGGSRKIFLTPLARYWVNPCCGDPSHVSSYRTPGFLPRLGTSVTALRDALFVKKVNNFRVLCPNKMIGVGQRKMEPSDEEAAKTAALWGPNPVHPSSAAYRMMADCIENDINNPEARYTNPAKLTQGMKRPHHDPSQDRTSWVSGCSAALARRDSRTHKSSRDQAARGWTDTSHGHLTCGHSTCGQPNCGQRMHTRGRGYYGSLRGSFRGGRKPSGFRRGYSF
jgi:hypothetical protein